MKPRVFLLFLFGFGAILLFLYYKRPTPSEGFVRKSYTRDIELPISLPFRFPFRIQMLSPYVLFPTKEAEAWINSIKGFLEARHKKDKLVPIIVCDNSTESLSETLNWLITFQQNTGLSARDVLVITTDLEHQKTLKDKDMSAVYIRKESLFKHSSEHDSDTLRLMMKWTVIRIVSNWGYDIVAVDPDFVFLRDPHSLFERYPNSQVIGPSITLRQLTLCKEMVFVRSSPAAELFWDALAIGGYSESEQPKISLGITKLKVEWKPENNCPLAKITCTVHGSGSGVNMTLVPKESACCKCGKRVSLRTEDSYAWLQDDIFQTGKNDPVIWKLKDNWRSIDSGNNADEWIKSISKERTS